VVVWSKTYVCGYLIAGIAGSNPAEEVDVGLLCLFCVCVFRRQRPLRRADHSFREALFGVYVCV
jgi:hypothetical protein